MLAKSQHVRESDIKLVKLAKRRLSKTFASRDWDDWQNDTTGAKKGVALGLIAIALICIWAVIALGPLNEDMDIVYYRTGLAVPVDLPTASRQGCLAGPHAEPFACADRSGTSWFFPPTDAERNTAGLGRFADNQSLQMSAVAGIKK